MEGQSERHRCLVMKVSEFQGEYRFLSNFWRVSIDYEGITYPSTEHAYQAAKTLDRVSKFKVRNQKTPGEAKRLGKVVAIRPDWEEVKLDVMLELLRLKFSDESLRQRLLTTGDAELVEGNLWYDTFWGVCPPDSDNGENNLGKLLMKVRDEINART